MAIAAVAPRVRTIVFCDAVAASPTEDGVFTLEGVRQRLTAESFPWRATLRVFLVGSSPRKGRFTGKILVVKEPEDRWIRYMKFVAAFEEDNEVAPVIVDAEGCVFPAAGQYVVEVFFDARGGEALKGEHPFVVSGQRSEPCPEESFCRGLLRYSTSLPNR